jgi:DNA adenine methylase
LYQQIQNGTIDEVIVKEYLKNANEYLKKGGQDYYLEIRKQFNEWGNPLDFLFLNRSCFNGVMRFNSKGGYNVPFGHKPERFAQAYITKIIHQISWIKKKMKDKDWVFEVADWKTTVNQAQKNDFIYLDPPYIGRNADYFNTWEQKTAIELAQTVQNLPCAFALSMWLENKYRKNDYIENHWKGLEIKTFTHFYHVGASEDLRNEMQEALVLSKQPLNASHGLDNPDRKEMIQFELFI